MSTHVKKQAGSLRKFTLFTATTLLTLVSVAVLAKDGHGAGNNRGRGEDHGNDKSYQETDLVSDLPDVAILQDTNLVNAWGLSFGPSTPFWISDNGTGLSTLYAVTNDSSGAPQVSKIGLEVAIPGEGNPTGQVFNNSSNFNSDLFIFASEDGTISGWRPDLGAAAEALVVRSTAVYKGVALADSAAGPMLLAANFSEGAVDVYDGGMNLVGQLSDPNAPAGYAPFNVQNLHGIVFVAYAKQDDTGEDDVPGQGHGLIDILDVNSGAFHRFATGSDAGGQLRAIDSPWGMAVAPDEFGQHGDRLLVGNFGSGTIMTFDEHGRFEGFLDSSPGKPIVIDGLWALAFGNGGRGGVPQTLYFTAGPGDESHGLFGSIEPINNGDNHGNSGRR